MKKIKKNYTNFILTVIAVAMIGILFKGEKIISPAHAIESHYHNALQIYGFDDEVRRVIYNCSVYGSRITC